MTMRPADEKVLAAARLASQAWRAAMRSRSASRIMDPRNENPYFDTPKFTRVLVSNVADTLVIGPDPNRVYVLFSVTSGTLWLKPGPLSDLVNPDGLYLSGQQPPFDLMQSESGPLCTSEWHAIATVASTPLAVVEVLLREWPKH